MSDLIIYVKYIIKLLLRIVVRILFLFPIKSNRILFTEYWGEKISDNPKCIYKFLYEKYGDKYEYVWVYNKSRESTTLPDRVKIIKRFSLKWFYYMSTSKVIVDNYTPTIIVPRRKGQYYIQTWHAGGSYKKVGVVKEKNKIEQQTLKKAMMTANLFVSSSKEFTKGNIEEGFRYTGEILNSGMPRNDVFFDKNTIQYLYDKVRKYYSIQGPIILYAPTFRGDVNHSDKMANVLDVDKVQTAFERRYNEKVNILVRCHFWDKHIYNFGENVINAGDYPDMQELLCASDVLITDYSSSMWDYAFLGRPCLLYTPDIDKYIRDRGFFTLPDEWPGIICRNTNELCKEIVELNDEDCLEKAKKHLELMGSYENGHATEMISNRIVSYLNNY